MAKLITNTEAINRAKTLRLKIDRLEKGFRRKHPFLIKYVDETRPICECSSSYFRDIIHSHNKTIKGLKKEAARLEGFGTRQQALF